MRHSYDQETMERSVPYFTTHASKIGDAIATVERYREAVGPEVDLCTEIHRRLTPSEAIALAVGIEHLHPVSFEDPIPPDDLDATTFVASETRIPIATGERLHTIHEFDDALLRRDAVGYVRSNLCLAGGYRELALEDGTMVAQKLRLEDGILIVPDAPGLGVDLVPDAERNHPWLPRAVVTRLGTDAAVVDQ